MKVLVIGAGIAGLSIARDLVLRRNEVMLIDKSELCKGTTSNCAGMLHSGARYLVSDPNIARICYQENRNIRKIARHCVGKRQGLFTILSSDTNEYSKTFQKNAKKIRIPIRFVEKKDLGKYEGNLNKNVVGGFLTDDYVIDVQLLTASYLLDLKNRKVCLQNNSTVLSAVYGNNRWNVVFSNGKYGSFDYVVNATGDNSDIVAQLFNTKLLLEKIYGSMFRFDGNSVKRIVTRAAKNTEGDVVVPLCKGTLIGSSWSDKSRKEAEGGIDTVMSTANKFLNSISKNRIDEIWTGVRTHEKKNKIKKTIFGSIKRDFSIISNYNSSPNFLTILPGKLTIARYVAFLAAKKIYEDESLKDISLDHYLPKVEMHNFFDI